MNTKLKELESQCWESRPYGPPWFNADKFAELIIRHVIWIAYHSHTMSKDAEFTQHLDAVREHFGIEEPNDRYNYYHKVVPGVYAEAITK